MSAAERPRKVDDRDIDGGWARRAAREQEARRSGRKPGDGEPPESGHRAGGDRGRGAPGRSEGRGGRAGEPRAPRAARADRAGGRGAERGRTGGAGGSRDERSPRGERGGIPRRERESRGDARPDAARGSSTARSGRATPGPGSGNQHGGRRGPDGGSGAGGRSRAADADRRSAGRPGRTGPKNAAGRSIDPPREVALEVLRAVRERDAYANLVLPKLLRDRRIDGRDAALATELAYGACRAQGLLDAVIAACAGRPVAQIDGPLLDVLRLGVYQLLRTRIGAHAAVDTSVGLARAEFGAGKSGFVNAVLRQAARRAAQEWVEELAPADPIGKLAFEYAHPVWIAQAFADALGARATELPELLAADDARPTVHLVARPGEITAEELALVTGGEEGRWSPYAVYLEGGDPGGLEPVREGMAAVQDEGSQLVALSLTRAPLDGPDTGRWLDLCAGPGGKAALLGALAAIDGFEVDAVEPAEHRAELVRTATRELPVRVHVADGRDSGLSPGYDRILVDAPCTGLGALRRRPEARWRRGPEDLRDLVRLQRELLTAAWDLLRPGGVVVYSTCSPHLAETVSVVADLVRRTDAEQLDTRDLLPGVSDVGDGPAAQLWPHRHGTDAMFMAALRKPR